MSKPARRLIRTASAGGKLPGMEGRGVKGLGGRILGRITGWNALTETESGAKPVKITVSHTCIVGGEAFKCKAEVVVDQKDIAAYPFAGALALDVDFPQQDLPLKVTVGARAEKS